MRTIQIYIRLIEGAITFVPVNALSLSDEQFEILENPYMDIENDITSIWEYFPTDVVKCKYVDSNLVAYDLLNSQFPKRNLHRLIFLIVENEGRQFEKEFNRQFSIEISELISANNLIQKRHPLVKKWIQEFQT